MAQVDSAKGSKLPSIHAVRRRESGGLLEATIILLLSVAMVIFIVTMAGKFLGDENFERLPDFIKNSYISLYTLLTAGGLAGLTSLINGRGSPQISAASCIFYTLGCTAFALLFIGAAVVMAPNPLERFFQNPPQTTPLNVAEKNVARKSFALSQTIRPNIRFEISGNVEVINGRVIGHVNRGSLSAINGPGEPIPRDLEITTISLNLCHFALVHGQPSTRFSPETIVEKNYLDVKFNLSKNPDKTFFIGPFDFSFNIPTISFAKTAWLCATASNTNRTFSALVQ
ncbi:hypothetical protein GOZ78_17450 [Agrobacterium vitis]|uniref:Uncharacterized protein n=1 Tax=Agrobacterium vitis TaxID=373 RepID=A0ABD6GA38_AGRVI|nr:hypothetical protein [Agrobacterium vitis]MUO79378.1 hypothetical protein [Agrobacterium vitis]MUO96203.1 hypothetical protein [Agrobacterium vitis]MUP05732.1 hypothetical protein [Agrobacterium vitis]MUZ82816.1 hypothetical protein [Agrobacterium vitis]MVA11808.1 hypothetical protein [Agrobacterium vitis]